MRRSTTRPPRCALAVADRVRPQTEPGSRRPRRSRRATTPHRRLHGARREHQRPDQALSSRCVQAPPAVQRRRKHAPPRSRWSATSASSRHAPSLSRPLAARRAAKAEHPSGYPGERRPLGLTGGQKADRHMRQARQAQRVDRPSTRPPQKLSARHSGNSRSSASPSSANASSLRSIFPCSAPSNPAASRIRLDLPLPFGPAKMKRIARAKLEIEILEQQAAASPATHAVKPQ